MLRFAVLAVVGILYCSLAPAQELRAIYQELVETNTTASSGSCTVAAKAIATRLTAAGFGAGDMQLIIPPGGPEKGILVARLKGSGARRPLMLLAHLDVVEAKREDWVKDPFKLIEEDGYFYGRGSFDNKAQAAIFVANLLRFKREGKPLKRDLILALTCDEETVPSAFDGVDYLLRHHRNLIDAELALAEGGSIAQAPDGKLISHGVQAGEKVFQSFSLEVSNKGGHSSTPFPDNAIVQLAEGLARIGHYQFPFSLNPVTRAYFGRAGELTGGQTGKDMLALLHTPPDAEAVARLAALSPIYNASVRTTCVPTMLNAGHASNALPQRATAIVNCRILPGEKVEDVRATLLRVAADEHIRISDMGVAVEAPAPPLNPELMQAVQTASAALWPGLAVIPTMAVGATDGRFLNTAGIPTYGVSGLIKEANGSGLHGLNERLSVKSFYDGQKFLYDLTKALAE